MRTLLLAVAGLWGVTAIAASPQPETVSLVVNGGLRICTKGNPGQGCQMPDMANAQDIKVILEKMPPEEGQAGDAWQGTWTHAYGDGAAKFTLQVAVIKASEPESPDRRYTLEFQITPDPPGGSPQVLRISMATLKRFNRFRWDAAALPGTLADKEASPVLYFGTD